MAALHRKTNKRKKTRFVIEFGWMLKIPIYPHLLGAYFILIRMSFSKHTTLSSLEKFKKKKSQKYRTNDNTYKSKICVNIYKILASQTTEKKTSIHSFVHMLVLNVMIHDHRQQRHQQHIFDQFKNKIEIFHLYMCSMYFICMQNCTICQSHWKIALRRCQISHVSKHNFFYQILLFSIERPHAINHCVRIFAIRKETYYICDLVCFCIDHRARNSSTWLVSIQLSIAES